MRSALICEGSTDLVLLQYFLEKTYNWSYTNDQNTFKINSAKSNVWLKNGDDYLCIINSGGVSRLLTQLENLLLFNLSSLDSSNIFDKIVLISDNDESDTISNFVTELTSIFLTSSISLSENLENDKWINGKYTAYEQIRNIDFLMLVLPFDENGAIENFLLKALKENSLANDEDKVIYSIVEQCQIFIDNIDVKEQYLKKRREKIKATFSTVFVILTPAEAFAQRKTLLQSAKWEEYITVQNAFEKLATLKT